MKTCQVEHNKIIWKRISNAYYLLGKKTLLKPSMRTVNCIQWGSKKTIILVCSEAGGKYVFHFVNNLEERGDMIRY